MAFKQILSITKKEVLHSLKNCWILLIAVVFVLIDYSVINFSSTFGGFNNQTNPHALIMSLLQIQMYIIPLFAFIISYDSMLKEQELGTLNLLLTYPLRDCDLVLGKWLGHSCVIALAILLSFILPSYSLFKLGFSLNKIASVILLCISLGIIFVSLGLFVSTLSKDRTMVIALGLILWLFFVFIFDLAFVLLTVYSNGHLLPNTLNFLLLFNPIDLFRIITLLIIASPTTLTFYGLGQGVLQLTYCLFAFLLWLCLPLLLTLRKYLR